MSGSSGARLRIDCDVFADHTAKHADRLLDDFIQLQGPALDHLFAAVGQKLVGERGCAHGRLLNLAKIRGEFLFEFPGSASSTRIRG